MNTKDLFASIQLAVTLGVFAIVLMLTSAKINHAIFTRPDRDLYVTADYDQDQKAWNEQTKAYENACKPITLKQSYLHVATALLFLLITVALHTSWISIAFMIAGLWELLLVSIGSWDVVGTYLLIACLLVALGLLGFSLYRQDTKK